MKYVLVIFSLCFIAHVQRVWTQAGLSFNKHIIDPDEMVQHVDFPDTYQYTFSFKNTGNEPVLFTRCQCPCGCFIINDFPKEVMQPGYEGRFTVSFWRREGAIQKSVYLHTNIPDSNDPAGYKRYEFKVAGEF
jgi:hypothetical protein